MALGFGFFTGVIEIGLLVLCIEMSLKALFKNGTKKSSYFVTLSWVLVKTVFPLASIAAGVCWFKFCGWILAAGVFGGMVLTLLFVHVRRGLKHRRREIIPI